ncbi:MAG: hypothetical protein RR312_03060 [Bacteroidales bacterium]
MKRLINSILSILKILKHRSFIFNLDFKNLYKNDRKIYVLGNGPSIHHDILTQYDYLKNKDVCVVNEFGLTEYYVKIEPSMYVFADPAYFRGRDLLREDIAKKREQLFQTITKKTTWKLQILIPYFPQQDKSCLEILAKNQNIQILRYSILPIFGDERMLNLFYKKNWGMPLAQNVLISALYLCIGAGYKEINIFGADHTWTEDIFVDEKNQLCFKDKHFYNLDVKMEPLLDTYGNVYRIHQFLEDISLMFRSYVEVERFAQYMDCDIYNCSSISFIDSFRRKLDCRDK